MCFGCPGCHFLASSPCCRLLVAALSLVYLVLAVYLENMVSLVPWCSCLKYIFLSCFMGLQAGVYAWLFVLSILYLLLAVYLDNVVPDANGVRKPVFFFLYPSFWTGKASQRTRTTRASERLLSECKSCLQAVPPDYVCCPCSPTCCPRAWLPLTWLPAPSLWVSPRCCWG